MSSIIITKDIRAAMVQVFEEECDPNGKFEQIRQIICQGPDDLRACARYVDETYAQDARGLQRSPERTQHHNKCTAALLAANGKMLEIHNYLYQTDAEYRAKYQAFYTRQITQYYPVIQENDVTRPHVFFRGIQDTPASFGAARPDRCFNVRSTSAAFSLLKQHHGGTGIVFPKIFDPYFVSETERKAKQLGWTRGTTSYSLDVVRGVRFATGNLFPEKDADRKVRFAGYLYISLPEKFFSMNEHLHAGLTDEATGNARSAYEICAVDMSGDRTPIVIGIDGTGSMNVTQNEQCDIQTNTALQQFARTADGTPFQKLADLAERHANVFDYFMEQKDNRPSSPPRVEAFERSLSPTEAAHATKVQKRIAERTAASR